MHALAFICSINGAEIQKYVDDYYSVEKFKAAYVGRIPSMTDKLKGSYAAPRGGV
jgi:hypothetical protein